MLQDEYRAFYKRKNPSWDESVVIYKKFVEKEISSDTIILEAGCGFSNMFQDIYSRVQHVIGVDINEEFLNKNPLIKEKIVADLSSIPQVADNSIDLIISSWVFEHLKCPSDVFSEFRRVLKKGGKLIFITPNSWNYVVILNRIIPMWLRKIIVGSMSKNLVTDPMPVFYKANSLRRIKRLASRNSLKIKNLVLNGDPTYIAISKFFFYIGILIEIILNIHFFRKFKVHLIGVLEKQ
jgi:ubiquinone/menaquinone biosynthesis C-methylase UbiE